MRRLDLVFGAVVTALAVFVAVEARSARVYSEYLGGAVSAPIASSGSETRRVRPAETPVTGDVSAPRDLDDIRRRLREGSPGTYVDELLLQRDSALARWPERRTRPLRVWIQPDASVADFGATFPDIVRAAFDEWSSTGIPLSFSFVSDSTKADVHVTWIDRFDEQISGK